VEVSVGEGDAVEVGSVVAVAASVDSGAGGVGVLQATRMNTNPIDRHFFITPSFSIFFLIDIQEWQAGINLL